MPTFTLDLTEAHVQRLQALAARYRDNTGEALTVHDWIVLHLKEMAINADLAALGQRLRPQLEEQANADLEAALKAERERLLATLGQPAPPSTGSLLRRAGRTGIAQEGA